MRATRHRWYLLLPPERHGRPQLHALAPGGRLLWARPDRIPPLPRQPRGGPRSRLLPSQLPRGRGAGAGHDAADQRGGAVPGAIVALASRTRGGLLSTPPHKYGRIRAVLAVFSGAEH